jgi:hypothetical protein
MWGAEAVKRLAAGESSFYLGSQEGKLVAIPFARIHDKKPGPPKELAALAGILAR